MISLNQLSCRVGILLCCCAGAGATPVRDGGAPVQPAIDRTIKLVQELSDPRGKDVLVVAHRAGWHYAPENSMQGVLRCIAMGVDMLVIDVRTTSDGKLVLMHDKTLDRTTDGTGPVSGHTLAEIQQLHLRDFRGRLTSDRVPTLDEVVNASRGNVLIYLDKTEDCIDDIYPQLVRMNAVGFSFFYGSRTRESLQSRYGTLVNQIAYLPKLDDQTAGPADYIDAYGVSPSAKAFVIEFKTDDSIVIQSIPRMSRTARVWASPLLPWMVAGRTDTVALKHPEQSWGWMIDHGVSMFCTDEPLALLAYLRGRHLHE